jgi:hypothetical protein
MRKVQLLLHEEPDISAEDLSDCGLMFDGHCRHQPVPIYVQLPKSTLQLSVLSESKRLRGLFFEAAAGSTPAGRADR